MRAVARIVPGPAWRPGRSVWQQDPVIGEHLAFMRAAFEDGSLLLGGPLATGMSGVAVLEVRDVRAAEAFAQADPAVAAGVLTYEVDELVPYFDALPAGGAPAAPDRAEGRLVTPGVSRAPVELAVVAAHLPGWDHADAFEVAVRGEGPDDALAAARCLLDLSGTGRRVLRLRDRAVRVVGLQPSVTVTTGVDLFPVLSATPELAVVGLDDRHLDFRILVGLAGGRVRCTTAVRRHNMPGHAYFAVVKPFHLSLVPRLLRRAARRGWRPPAEADVRRDAAGATRG